MPTSLIITGSYFPGPMERIEYNDVKYIQLYAIVRILNYEWVTSYYVSYKWLADCD